MLPQRVLQNTLEAWRHDRDDRYIDGGRLDDVMNNDHLLEVDAATRAEE